MYFRWDSTHELEGSFVCTLMMMHSDKVRKMILHSQYYRSASVLMVLLLPVSSVENLGGEGHIQFRDSTGLEDAMHKT